MIDFGTKNLAGMGLAYLDTVQPHLAKRQLACVLEDWCPPFPGYHLYYTQAAANLRERSRYLWKPFATD